MSNFERHQHCMLDIMIERVTVADTVDSKSCSGLNDFY